MRISSCRLPSAHIGTAGGGDGPTTIRRMENARGFDVAWFGALCDDDAEYLGVAAPDLLSSWQHCSDLVGVVDRLAFDSVLLPSGYELGIDTVSFAAAMAPSLVNLAPLVAASRIASICPARPPMSLGHRRPFSHRAFCGTERLHRRCTSVGFLRPPGRWRPRRPKCI